MKLNQVQATILGIVQKARKATYEVATAECGNGKTIGALVEKGLLEAKAATSKSPRTFSLTAAGRDALKAHAKKAKLAVA